MSGQMSRRKVKANLPRLTIGDDCIIGANAILYIGSVIGNNVMIGDMAVIREQTIIGDGSLIGMLVTIEYEVKIGKDVKIMTDSHITGMSIIEDNVFIGSKVSTTNDNAMGRGTSEKNGVHIFRGARIGSNVTILPGIEIGPGATVAAGSIVTKHVRAHKTVMGIQAVEI